MRIRRALAAAAFALAATGCSVVGTNGIYDMPLPGGADLGDHPYRVTVQFADVLDLVPQAAVKVNDVVVGRVESIGLGGPDGWTAEVLLAVNGDVDLPADAVASLRQSSLLGEKFVELAAPGTQTPAPSADKLADGATITADRTNRHTEVEEVFGALSLLLNGGGIGQLQTINRELSDVLTGNEPEIKAFLSNVDELVTHLDNHRGDITAALDGLNQLSTTLAGRQDQIKGALTDLTPGLRSLSEQRSALVTMLQSLDTLSDVAVDTIDRSRDDMVADLEALAPVLNRLADAGQSLPQALEILPTFPFTDPVLDAAKGDYLNIFVTVKPTEDFTQPLPPLPLPPTGQTTSGGR
ncbi:MAG: MCE family protein [Actinophytocola sp.]|uniref:MCE family protein n=1 Tax=Actinophytocola sp. TaxID=1872138 RepID=UPI0013261A07|nr:MCE family protein [Actinophytocola sp.]MPZ84531.1 MCE family protein [Actinophytocola sp.]